ncbi:hypothetical protein HYO65_gp151 [Tenacibaculum phage PTm1]|uniref:Uncharacterized protein n=2 Tax=Shirahamavirus PTm1 TaxID=2846435 RepID=A0A5S9HXF5_9CAUD|nr:hypothetical protein HYO65_gp151 [Tenacibaculum phage PTm1]BBI90543.1 hypothetical protein [Tenacibaculum phage PTm1]BBI90851.1 hypothetical protein [Tenacibaculum phage PTm5]
MPKVGVVKLDEFGEYTGQSTFSGTASIPIHYSFQKINFISIVMI